MATPSPESTAEAPRPAGRHDHAERRRALRKARERGCSIYIPAEILERTGYDPFGPVPFYRVWGAKRGRVVVQLYRVK